MKALPPEQPDQSPKNKTLDGSWLNVSFYSDSLTGISDFNFMSPRNDTPAALSGQSQTACSLLCGIAARFGRSAALLGLFPASNLPPC